MGSSLKVRYKITVEGVVQGVGFRPFVCKNAKELGLNGYVLNDSRGVLIDIEGDKNRIETFIKILKTTPPKTSKIDSISSKRLDRVLGMEDFIIKESLLEGINCSILPSDKAICSECLRELKDPKNSRFRYPFINCIDCGPRYSIIKTLPFDRIRTSMDVFEMCESCSKEYSNFQDRRYHAQPISCPKCGPKLTLYRNNGTSMASDYKAIEATAKLIKKGHIVAIKGIGGFHLICDATKSYLVQKLRDKKRRPYKPFAVMFRTLNDISKCTELTPLEEELILSPERPIVLLNKRKPHRLEKFCISCDSVAPYLNTMGVFLPYSPIHVMLFELIKTPLVVTSANISGELLIANKDEIESRLGDVYDYLLDYDREITNPIDDSVITIQNHKPQIIRRGRGYGPVNIKLPFKVKKNILALGSRQKNSIAIAFEDNCIISPYVGNLDNIKTLQYFYKILNTFLEFYIFKPELVVLDKHPEFEYREWVKSSGLESIEVQHHHAHLLALATEKNILEESYLGIAFDGVGYGEDGKLWGGEFFICEKDEIRRVGHFKEFLLLGGDKAAKEPRRIAFAILYEIYGDSFLDMDIPLLKQMKSSEKETFKKMYDSKLNSFYTTSVGRIFDAVAALAQDVYFSTYEGECGMRLEALVDEECEALYTYTISEGVIDISAMFIEILEETNRALIASKFINTIASIILDIAKQYNKKVLLSGGVFQNRALCTKIIKLLEKHQIQYEMHEIVPTNDCAIALGQVAYAHLKNL